MSQFLLKLANNCPSNEEPIEIKLTCGKVAIVDKETYLKVNKYYWRAKKSGSCWYAVRRYSDSGGTHEVRMHREIAGTGPLEDCHHINGNSLDNRRVNLRNLDSISHFWEDNFRRLQENQQGTPTET